MPVVSVILAYHRVTPFLAIAVRSVLGQTLRDLELVLVDNGTGAGLEALGEAGRDSRVRLVELPTNAGIATAHNLAVAQAKGEFVALMDYDDVALPARFERQVAALRADPLLGLVSGAAETIDREGRVRGGEFSLSGDGPQRAYTQYAAPVVTPVFTGRREVFLQLPYRAEFTFAADYDFLARAAERYRFAAVPDVVLYYRRHPDQTTVRQAGRIEFERGVVRLLAARRRAGRPEGDDWRGWLADAPEGATPSAAPLRVLSRRCLDEGFPTLAAYHARRSVAVERRPGAAAAAIALFARIWGAAGRERGPAARMFLRGPVLALGVRPVGQRS